MDDKRERERKRFAWTNRINNECQSRGFCLCVCVCVRVASRAAALDQLVEFVRCAGGAGRRLRVAIEGGGRSGGDSVGSASTPPVGSEK